MTVLHGKGIGHLPDLHRGSVADQPQSGRPGNSLTTAATVADGAVRRSGWARELGRAHALEGRQGLRGNYQTREGGGDLEERAACCGAS